MKCEPETITYSDGHKTQTVGCGSEMRVVKWNDRLGRRHALYACPYCDSMHLWPRRRT